MYRPDLVVSDIAMPYIDGIDTAVRIRNITPSTLAPLPCRCIRLLLQNPRHEESQPACLQLPAHHRCSLVHAVFPWNTMCRLGPSAAELSEFVEPDYSKPNANHRLK